MQNLDERIARCITGAVFDVARISSVDRDDYVDRHWNLYLASAKQVVESYTADQREVNRDLLEKSDVLKFLDLKDLNVPPVTVNNFYPSTLETPTLDKERPQ